MYLLDKRVDPRLSNHLAARGVKVDRDIYSLSEMIQWLWRGCIRKGEPMNIYIPNLRMRQLLIDWLNGAYEHDTRMYSLVLGDVLTLDSELLSYRDKCFYPTHSKVTMTEALQWFADGKRQDLECPVSHLYALFILVSGTGHLMQDMKKAA